MKLFWSSRSPFARKVTVVAGEAGVADQVTLERVVVAAAKLNPAVMRDNPLNRIPTLILPDGQALYDSRVICRYLAELGDGAALYPAGGTRWTALRLEALGDGLMDVLVARLGERNRPAALRSAEHEEAFSRKIEATLDALERGIADLGSGPPHIGSVAVGCALAHLDFRAPAENWRGTRPALAAWHETLARRPSMALTGFRDEY